MTGHNPTAQTPEFSGSLCSQLLKTTGRAAGDCGDPRWFARALAPLCLRGPKPSEVLIGVRLGWQC